MRKAAQWLYILLGLGIIFRWYGWAVFGFWGPQGDSEARLSLCLLGALVFVCPWDLFKRQDR